MAARLAIDALQASKQKLADIMIEIKEQSEILLEQERVAALKEGQSKVRSRGYDVAVSQVEVTRLVYSLCCIVFSFSSH